MKRMLSVLCLVLLCPLGWAESTTTAAWPNWRGASYDGSANDESFALGSGVGFRVTWKKALGSGYSSVSIADGRAITLYSDTKHDYLVAYAADSGEELWRYQIAETYDAPDASFDGPLSTPAIDGDMVFGVGPLGQIFAVRVADGKQVWQTSMETLGSPKPDFGWTTSPLVTGTVVIIETGGEEGKGITALDRKDGSVLWTTGDAKVNYQSPVLAEIHGTTQVVCAGDQSIHGLDPQTGKELWQIRYEGQDQSPTPLPVGENRIYVRHAGRQGMLLEVRKDGDSYTAEQLWISRDIKNTHDSAVYHDGYLYGYSGPFLTCVNAATGERTWRSRQPGEGFLILVNDSLIVLTRAGDLVAVSATPEEYREVATSKLFDSISWSPPSFAGGKIYARTFEEIACVGIAKAEQPLQIERVSDAGKLPDSELAAFIKKVDAVDSAESKAALIDGFLEQQERFPIIEGNRIVHFIYRGEVEDIAVTGDFSELGETPPMHQVEGTDLYYYSLELAPDARISYTLQKDFEEQITDPRNPNTATSLGAEQSILSMPEWQDSDHLAENLLETFEHTSSILESTRQIKVWLPPFYHTSEQRYPVLYVHYGSFAITDGHLVRSLNNLVGRTVQPVIAVFIHLNQELEYPFAEVSGEHKDQYARMVAEEILPLIDSKYRTLAVPEARATMGASAAGTLSALMAFWHPGVFGWVVGQSTNTDSPLGEQLHTVINEATEQVPTRFFLHWGSYDLRSEPRQIDRAAGGRELTRLLQEKGYEVLGGEMPHGYGFGSWQTVNDTILETLFPLEGAAK